jgi:CHAT domain-containing protein
MEQQRSRVGEEGSRTLFAERAESFYHDLIGVEVTQGAFEPALLTLERSRAQSLLEMLAERDLLRAAKARLPIPLQDRLARLKDQRRALAQSYGERRPSPTPFSLDAWLARSTALDAEEEVLAREIRGAAPGFAELVYPEPASFAEIEQALEPGTLLLAYSVGDSVTYLLAGLRELDGKFSGRAIRIECDAEQLGVRIAAWSLLLAHSRTTPRDANWRPPAAAFYRELIAPVERELAQAKRVILVLDGPLHLLPFAALVADATDSPPFGVRFPLTIVPSMTTLRELRRRHSGQTPELSWAGLGDPGPGLLPLSEPANTGGDVPPAAALPGARAELITVSAMLAGPTRLLLGDAATERAAKALPTSTRMVHFACHARTNGRFPMQSELLLAPDPPSDATRAGVEDGALQAWEILDDVRLDTELVVLSACDTGIGKLSGGEGVVGLSRAFLFAGTRSLLASLWPVADRSGSRLVVGFYESLLAGLPKDEALRRSRARILEESPEAPPYLWAGLELFGDPAPVQGIASHGNWKAAVGAAFLSVGAGLLGLAWRLSRSRRTFPP